MNKHMKSCRVRGLEEVKELKKYENVKKSKGEKAHIGDTRMKR